MVEARVHASYSGANVSVPGPKVFVYRGRRRSRIARRSFDIATALALLVITLPIVVLAGAAIAIEDGFPILFIQTRVGRYGRAFAMIKLRTMKRERCGSEYKPTSKRDNRITRVGQVLRAMSIDELPQLVNVLRGEMSIVGPRPEMPFIVARYEQWQHLRHLVCPGLTCIWQVRHRSIPLDAPSATLHDLSYIRSASPGLDLTIVFQTVLAVCRLKGGV